MSQRNDERVISLAKELISEIEAQGFKTMSKQEDHTVKHISVWVIDGKVSVDNACLGWTFRDKEEVVNG